MIICADRMLAFDYLRTEVGLTWSEDFRGMLIVPDRFRGKVMAREHVAAAFGFNNFCGRTACFHVSVKDRTGLHKQTLREVFDFAFNACGLAALLATIDSTNVASCKFAVKVGGRLVHVIPEGGLDGDLHCYQMLREDCPWLKEAQHGKRLAAAA